MLPRIALKRSPQVSFRPSLLLEAVPWLMLAAAMRVVIFGGGLAVIPAEIVANASIFLAFLVTARRMIEFTEGTTALGYLSFGQQLAVAYRVLHPVGLVIVALYMLAAAIGARFLVRHIYFGFDGIAFDQYSDIGRVWSALIAALIFLMVVRAEHGRPPSFLGAIRELGARWKYLLPAIAAVALFHIILSPVQGAVRWWVYLFWNGTAAPEALKAAVYFVFIFGFASLRLWGTIAILTFALRASYRAAPQSALTRTNDRQ